MNTKLLITGTVIISICIISSIMWSYKVSRNEWVKPSIVPESALWIGGSDGGVWVEVVDFKPDAIRFRIYRDMDGVLMLDADFCSANCQDMQITKENLAMVIKSYDGENFNVKDENKACGIGCQLVPIIPTYYDERISAKDIH